MRLIRLGKQKCFQRMFPTHSVWKKASRSEVSMAVGVCFVTWWDVLAGYLEG